MFARSRRETMIPIGNRHDSDRERQHDRADVFDFPHQHRSQPPWWQTV